MDSELTDIGGELTGTDTIIFLTFFLFDYGAMRSIRLQLIEGTYKMGILLGGRIRLRLV